MSKRFVISFYTTDQAIRCEAVCQDHALQGRLVPTPRELSAGCGMAWACSPDLAEATLDLIQHEGIAFEACAEV